ncbi:MAG: hypothetical protein JWM88_418 [Verrucomicrobia bacterium]|nr:hypothetical protein [Verrucomicrobiota bacterium]
MIVELLPFLRFVALLGAGLLLPGWLLGRALRAPGGLIGAFLGSAAILTHLLLLLDTIGVKLDAARFALATLLICAGLATISKLRGASKSDTRPTGDRGRWRSARFYLWMLPALLGAGAIAALASLTPLSGWDVGFRWNFLAGEIIRTGTMGFYPPVTADDFLHYSWCDGIAPLVSSLYLWAYFSLGRIEDWATAPVIIAQGLILFCYVGKLAASRGGPAAGLAARALLATSAVLLWSVAMGQETGLTALSLVAMFWFIEKGGESGIRWMVWAGLAAGVGALAREYGLLFPALGLFALAWSRRPRRHSLVFLSAAAVVAVPWYLRVWLKTGHPLYCFELGTLFPLNPVHVEYMHLIAHDFNLLANPEMLAPLPGWIAALAGVPLVLGLIGGCARWRESGAWLGAMAAVFAVWCWIAGLTAGGGLYSMRMLSPAIALGAVLGGIWLSRVVAARRSWIVALVLAGLAVHAGETALYLPVEPYPKWWENSPQEWRITHELGRQWRNHPRWAAIVAAAEGRKILVSDPTMYTVLREFGAHTVPLFSPEVRFLFQASHDFNADAARLRLEGFRFVILSTVKGSPETRLVGAHPFFPALAKTRTAVPVTRFYALYDLYPPENVRAVSMPERPAGPANLGPNN